MEKRKNGLYGFESHDEIRAYLAQGFPSRVYLQTFLCTFVQRDGRVVYPNDEHMNNGTKVPQSEIERGVLYEPEQTSVVTAVGLLEDFPVEGYVARHNFVRHTVEAATVMEGLYEAGDVLASRLKTAEGERRTMFSAKDITAGAGKGGALLVWPEGEQEVLYTIRTADGLYQVSEGNLFNIIADMEVAESIDTSKRRRFTVRNEAQEGREVLVRMTFDADKMIPKMKNCWYDLDDLRPTMATAAIEIETGVMVSSDGHIMAAHKTKNFKAEIFSHPWADKVLLPREVMQMKGVITVEVTQGKGELLIVASDERGRQGTITQNGRYPNWRSVVPTKVGKGVNVDAAVWNKAAKQVLTYTDASFHGMILDAERGSVTMAFCANDYAYGKSVSIDVPINGGTVYGIRAGVNTKLLLKTLAFEPTTMHFTDFSRAILFHNSDSLIICMPMVLDDRQVVPCGPESDDETETFDVENWIEGKPTKPTRGKKSEGRGKKAAGKREQSGACSGYAEREQARPEVKAVKHQPSDIGHQTSIAEQLRAALLERLGRLAA